MQSISNGHDIHSLLQRFALLNTTCYLISIFRYCNGKMIREVDVITAPHFHCYQRGFFSPSRYQELPHIPFYPTKRGWIGLLKGKENIKLLVSFPSLDHLLDFFLSDSLPHSRLLYDYVDAFFSSCTLLLNWSLRSSSPPHLVKWLNWDKWTISYGNIYFLIASLSHWFYNHIMEMIL